MIKMLFKKKEVPCDIIEISLNGVVLKGIKSVKYETDSAWFNIHYMSNYYESFSAN